MDATAKRRERAQRPPLLRNERGMLLVITMLILLVVSTLAASNLINAFLERSISKNQNYASIALNAADAGVDHWVAWLADPANKPATPYNVATCVPGVLTGWPPSVTRTIPSGGQYTSSAVCKTDDEDRDKDGDTAEYVLYNNVQPLLPQGDAGNHGKFYYQDAREAVAARGYPVITISSQGTYGAAGYREIVMDVARVKDIPPGVEGAVTSKDPVDFGPSSAQAKDGRAHDANGLLCTAVGSTCECDDASTGLTVETGELVNSDIGNSDTVYPYSGATGVITETSGVCAAAECVLGFASEAAMLADQNIVIFEAPISDSAVSSALETLPAGKIVIVKGNFTMTAGTNIDLNHAKRLVVYGTFDALGSTTFTGLIVAKNFGTAGNLVLNGAVVCIGDGNATTKPFANGTVTLNFSCDALAASAGQPGYRIRLGWHRLR